MPYASKWGGLSQGLQSGFNMGMEANRLKILQEEEKRRQERDARTEALTKFKELADVAAKDPNPELRKKAAFARDHYGKLAFGDVYQGAPAMAEDADKRSKMISSGLEKALAMPDPDKKPYLVDLFSAAGKDETKEGLSKVADEFSGGLQGLTDLVGKQLPTGTESLSPVSYSDPNIQGPPAMTPNMQTAVPSDFINLAEKAKSIPGIDKNAVAEIDKMIAQYQQEQASGLLKQREILPPDIGVKRPGLNETPFTQEEAAAALEKSARFDTGVAGRKEAIEQLKYENSEKQLEKTLNKPDGIYTLAGVNDAGEAVYVNSRDPHKIERIKLNQGGGQLRSKTKKQLTEETTNSMAVAQSLLDDLQSVINAKFKEYTGPVQGRAKWLASKLRDDPDFQTFVSQVERQIMLVYSTSGKQTADKELERWTNKILANIYSPQANFEASVNSMGKYVTNLYNKKLDIYDRAGYDVGQFSKLPEFKYKPVEATPSQQGGGKTVVKVEENKKTGQKRYTYSDGTVEIR